MKIPTVNIQHGECKFLCRARNTDHTREQRQQDVFVCAGLTSFYVFHVCDDITATGYTLVSWTAFNGGVYLKFVGNKHASTCQSIMYIFFNFGARRERTLVPCLTLLKTDMWRASAEKPYHGPGLPQNIEHSTRDNFPYPLQISLGLSESLLHVRSPKASLFARLISRHVLLMLFTSENFLMYSSVILKTKRIRNVDSPQLNDFTVLHCAATILLFQVAVHQHHGRGLKLIKILTISYSSDGPSNHTQRRF